MIKLLQEPNGERISKIRVSALIVAVFLIVVVPISYYISVAKSNHDKVKDAQDQAMIQSQNSVGQQQNAGDIMKQKSGSAVDNMSSHSSNPLLGDNPIGGTSTQTTQQPTQSETTPQEQRPPMTGGNNVPAIAENPIAAEVNNQKLDRVKKKYDGMNTPISLGSHYQNKVNASQVEASQADSGAGHAQSQSAVQIPSTGIGLGGNLGTPSVQSQAGSSQDQSKQDEKLAFMRNATGGDEGSTENPNRKVNMKSKYTLFAGDWIPSIMISGLNTDLPGQVIAQVSTNVYDSKTGKYLLIPKGSRLIGMYDSKVAYMQKRILVAWKRVIFPDGASFLLQGLPGTDLAGYQGFYNPEGVDNHYWQLFGSSFIMGVITGAMQMSQNNTNPNAQAGGIGISDNPTLGQTMSGSLGQQLGQTGLQVTSKAINAQPTLTMPPGYEFNIMLTADLILTPYGKQYK